VPVGLKVFLTALAVVDDLGAVLVIAVFYTNTLHLVPLLVALGVVGLLVLCNRLGVRSLAVYLVAGLVIWLALHESGIHATLAGVALAFTVPTRNRLDAAQFSSGVRRELDEFDAAETGDLLVLTSQGQQEALHRIEQAAEQVQAPLLRLEHALQPLVHFGVLPLFALANAGVVLTGPGLTPIQPVTLGILAGLLVGKPLGILLASWLAVRRNWAALPAGTSWHMIHGVAWLGGIGFTVSIFVAMLAFGGVAEQLRAAKIGILVGSTVAGVVGALVIRRAMRTRATRGQTSD
jgi:NhaA family Na+:H+ antiporter